MLQLNLCIWWAVPHLVLKFMNLQRSLPPIAAPLLENCGLLQSFMNNELNSLVELSPENGWLSDLPNCIYLFLGGFQILKLDCKAF